MPRRKRWLDDLRGLRVIPLDGRYYLVYDTVGHDDAERRDTWPDGTWSVTGYLVSDQLTGPYHPLDREPLLQAPYSSARIVTAPDEQPALLATRDRDDDRRHDLGVVSDPAPIAVASDARLTVVTERLWTPGWRMPNDLRAVPPALVERGLAHGLVALDWARTHAENASVRPANNKTGIPRGVPRRHPPGGRRPLTGDA